MSTNENPNGSTASRANQATLGDFGETSPELYLDGYGPTMGRPVPREERADLEDGADSRELEGTGLAPADLSFVSRYDSGPERVRKVASGQYPPFHPDDETRADRREEEAEILEATGAPKAVADGGTVQEPQVPQADPEDPPERETVKLVTGITRVMHTPQIIEGETSGTGKTISVEHEELGISVRLDSAEIFAGESEFRDSRYFEIYTPARLRSHQRSNKAPGPRAGTDDVTSAADLPEPTHYPTLEEPDDAPEECPECGQQGAPWAAKRAPVCEACGYMDEEDEAEEDDGPDKWDLYERLNRGDTLILDNHRGEFMVTRVRTFVGTQTVNYVDVVKRESREWAEYTLQKVSRPDGTRLKVNPDGEPSVAINVDDPELSADFEITGNDTERLRRYIREEKTS